MINPQANVNYAYKAFGGKTVRNLVVEKIVGNAVYLMEPVRNVLMDFGDQTAKTNASWMVVIILDVRKILVIAKSVQKNTGEPSVTIPVTIQIA